MSINQNLFEEKGGPKPNALPLGQTGSHRNCDDDDDDDDHDKCCFTSTETVGLLGTGAQDGHLDFHTATEL